MFGLWEISESRKFDREARALRVGAAAMALGRRSDDREPEARAGLAARSAPEPCKRLLRLLRREPGALVGDGQAGNPVLLLRADRDRATFRAIELCVPDEVRKRPFERGPIAPDGHGLEGAGLDARPRSGTDELVEPDHLGWLAGGLLPRERQ